MYSLAHQPDWHACVHLTPTLHQLLLCRERYGEHLIKMCAEMPGGAAVTYLEFENCLKIQVELSRSTEAKAAMDNIVNAMKERLAKVGTLF
jgi:hypothetical protein